MTPSQENSLDLLRQAAFAQVKAEAEFERANAYGRHQSALGEIWIDSARSYMEGCKRQLRNRTDLAMEVCDPVDVAKAIIEGNEAGAA